MRTYILIVSVAVVAFCYTLAFATAALSAYLGRMP